MSLPYHRVINSSGNIHKENILDRRALFVIDKYQKQRDWKLKFKVFRELKSTTFPPRRARKPMSPASLRTVDFEADFDPKFNDKRKSTYNKERSGMSQGDSDSYSVQEITGLTP